MSDTTTPAADELLNNLLQLPTEAHKSDFVISLANSIGDAERTLGLYVVTPQLEGVFRQALSLVATALDENSSKGAWLHSSFGGGKSHFMSVLGLTLRNEPATLTKPGLSEAIAAYADRLANRKLFVLPLTMLGKASVESAVLGGYAKMVRELHPDCPLPAVYLADGMFDDARALRTRMGDTAFFAALNEKSQGGGGGWGDLTGTWDAASFEAALDGGQESADRRRLVGALVATFFANVQATAVATGEGMVNIDEGLSVVSRHAKDLGYDGIVLMLDEVVLWFATRLADEVWVNNEGPKLAKLVEAGAANRPVPFITFMARQKDLRDLVGDDVTQSDQLNISNILSWWEGRFDTFNLEMNNLRQIVQQRLLGPKSAAAASAVDQAFKSTTGKADERVVDTLCTDDADRAEFRRVYPFSPALISAVVDLSSVLQRDRTALRVLAQLLVDRRDSMRVGDLVPVGDLYDVIAEGDEPFGSEIKQYWAKAKQLYDGKLRPLLLAQYGLTDAQAEQLSVGNRDHPFCTDDRLMKTLLLAAIVPGSRTLGGLTASRLTALNHGTVKSPIPGQERAAVITKLNRWKAEIGEISLEGDPADPVASLQVVGIDTEGILRKAAAIDTAGARKRELRRLLNEALQLENPNSLLPTRTFVWKGTRRTVDVVFGNLADPNELRDDQLVADRNPKMVIDLPYDTDKASVLDDLARIETFVQERPATRTLCWVPQFLSQRSLSDLRNFIVIDHVLTGDNFVQHASHLSAQDRPVAKQVLASRRESLRDRLMAALRQAYRVDEPEEATVDTTLSAEQQFRSLDPTFVPRRPVAAGLSDAFDKLVGQLLTHLYPDHPDFEDEVKTGELRSVLAEVQRAAEQHAARLDIAVGPLRKTMRRIANPLKLGTMFEGHYEPGTFWKDHVDQRLAQNRPPVLTVGVLRSWLDHPAPRGLPRDVQDLVILSLAANTDRVFMRAGVLVRPELGKVDDDLELHTQALPPAAEWTTAVKRAADVFGVQAPPVVSAGGVAKLVGEIRAQAAEARIAVSDLDGQLVGRLGLRGLDSSVNRARSAVAARKLLEDIGATSDDAKLVRVLAEATAPTTDAAMGATIKQAGTVAAVLKSLNWTLVETASKLPGEWAASAGALRTSVDDALSADQSVVDLVNALRVAEKQATELLQKATAEVPPPQPPPPPPPPGGGIVEQGAQTGLSAAAAIGALDELRATLQQTMTDHGDQVQVDLTWTVRKGVTNS